MCLKGGWLVSAALVIGLIQSLAWMFLSIVGAHVYLCIIPVPPYESSSDFFPVTTVKLYFEGPECIPDGSYLGRFNDDYRNPDVLRLFTPDKVFAALVASFILNVAYFMLSLKCLLGRRQRKSAAATAAAEWQNQLLMGWSGMTLIICAVDVIFSVKFVMDVITLKNYMGDPSQDVFFSSARGNLAEIPYISLLLALVSSRFIGVWLWNFVIGLLFFFNTLCSKSLVRTPAKIDATYDAKQRLHVAEKTAAAEDRSTSMTLPYGAYDGEYDFGSHPEDLTESKRSKEAVTRFSGSAPKTVYPAEDGHGWRQWTSPKPNTSRDFWQMKNEGYVDDDDEKAVVEHEVEKSSDFEHDLKNFEQGQRKIRIVKPPLGKPVQKMRD